MTAGKHIKRNDLYKAFTRLRRRKNGCCIDAIKRIHAYKHSQDAMYKLETINEENI